MLSTEGRRTTERWKQIFIFCESVGQMLNFVYLYKGERIRKVWGRSVVYQVFLFSGGELLDFFVR